MTGCCANATLAVAVDEGCVPIERATQKTERAARHDRNHDRRGPEIASNRRHNGGRDLRLYGNHDRDDILNGFRGGIDPYATSGEPGDFG